jgi:hypothetical protein
MKSPYQATVWTDTISANLQVVAHQQELFTAADHLCYQFGCVYGESALLNQKSLLQFAVNPATTTQLYERL